MKKLMTILAVMTIALTAGAQIVQPIKWTGAVEGTIPSPVLFLPSCLKTKRHSFVQNNHLTFCFA